MRDGYRFEFGAFDKPDAPKAQALKPLEEAAEGFTQEDVDAAFGRCNERNRERGRL